MPPSQVRSRGGCITCKSRHKKCDETKPNCQQCERSGLTCSGYAFVSCDSEGKAVRRWPRIRSKPPTQQRNASAQPSQRTTQTISTDSIKQCTPTVIESVSENPFGRIGLSGEDGHEAFDFGTVTRSFDATPVPPHLPFGSIGSAGMKEGYQKSSAHHEVFDNQSSHSADYLPTAQNSMLYTYTQAIQASDYSTTKHSNLVLSQQFPLPAATLSSSPHAANPSVYPQDPEAVYVRRVIYGSLVLDRTLESNSLSFVLGSYASWIQRTAFDPVKVARKTKDLIVKHYGDSEDSRWTIILLANLIGRLSKSRSIDVIRTPEYLSIVSALRKQVCLRIARSKSHSHSSQPVIQDAIMLDNVVDTTMVFNMAGNMDPGLEFMREAAPIFLRACPSSPNKQIHLQTLFLQPVESLRDYAVMDIFMSVLTPRPMLFTYDTTIDPELGSSLLNFSDDAGIQWARGLPDQVTLVFARINTLRGASVWDSELFDELETTLRDFVPIPTVSNEPSLVIGKTAVQECWRQVAYIYLYMGLCGASANDPRVVRALSRFFNIVNSVRPGRVPDSFIMLCFVIASRILARSEDDYLCFLGFQAGIATRNEADRDIIRYRMLGVEEFRCRVNFMLAMLERLWKLVDSESRPAIWTDLKVTC